VITLRPDQKKLKDDIYAGWAAGHKNIIAVAPTGSGKTVVFSDIIHDNQNYPTVAIAHRQELVGQISQALARNNIYHKIIASSSVIQFCISRHIREFGKNFHHANAPVAVAGVQTIIRRIDKLRQWANQVRIWTQDECHHVLPDNQWGKACDMFPNAVGLGVTATPIRCDKRPMGRNHGGVFDLMVQGPDMRQLISMGHLCDYRVFMPPASIDLNAVKISAATGEFNQHSLRKEAHKSTVTGDIVQHYLNIAPGKRGITFVVDVEQAVETAARFNAAGVPAMALSAKSNDSVRQAGVDRFVSGEIKQLVNVDLFGEGFDVPMVEVVSAGRPTKSFGLFAQQFGRMCRTAPGKTHGIYIDHVGNIAEHGGPPDRPQNWSLDMTNRRKKNAVDPFAVRLRTCMACFSAYESFIGIICPYCGHEDIPTGRGGPEFVQGNLIELDAATLAAMRGQVTHVQTSGPQIPVGATPIMVAALKKHWVVRQETARNLEQAIDQWAGIQIVNHGRTLDQAYRIFYQTYGVDPLTSQTMKRPEMDKLLSQVREVFY